MRNLTSCIFILFLLSSGYCSGRKKIPDFTRVQVAFWGLDNTDRSIEGRYPKDIYVQEISDSSMVKVLSNYPKWKRSPSYKCSYNARIDYFFNDSLVQSFEALFGESCSYVRVLINNKGVLKKIPEELWEYMWKIRTSIPAKPGWIVL